MIMYVGIDAASFIRFYSMVISYEKQHMDAQRIHEFGFFLGYYENPLGFAFVRSHCTTLLNRLMNG